MNLNVCKRIDWREGGVAAVAMLIGTLCVAGSIAFSPLDRDTKENALIFLFAVDRLCFAGWARIVGKSLKRDKPRGEGDTK